MTDTTAVFGISLGTWANKDYGFVQVVATIQGDAVIPVARPREDFPTEGNIFVSEQYWVPPLGGAAVWRAHETGAGKPGTRHAHFSAMAKGQPGPLEIISISAKSTDADRIRRILLNGVILGYGPGNQVLLETTDGRIVGPVRVEAGDPESPQSIHSRQEAFLDPLPMWPSPAELGVLDVRWQGKLRRFAASLHIPSATSFIDCMELGDSARLVLKFVSSLKLEGLDFTKKQIEALSSALSQNSPPSRISTRAERVVTAMKEAVRTKSQVEEVTTFLLASDLVKQMLSKIEEEVRQAEVARLAGQSSEAKQHISTLQARQAALREESHRLEGQLSAIEKRGPSLVDKLTERLFERISAFQENPPEAIANLALVKPLLRRSSDTQLSLQQPNLPSSSTGANTLNDLVAGLEDGLRSIGLVQGAARIQAREVAAAALAGQFVIFRGSLAGVFAELSATTFGGENTRRVEVPVGLLNGVEMGACVGRVVDLAKVKASVSTLILDNLNLSAFEVYGWQLHDIVARRQLSRDAAGPPILFFGSLASGGAALPVATSLMDISAVFDTDVLAFTQAEAPSTRAILALSSERWEQWRKGTIGTPEGTERLGELQEKLATKATSLWKRTTSTAYRYLKGVGLQAPLQSLAFGWLIPRATLGEAPAAKLPSDLDDGLLDGTSPDQRILKLVEQAAGPANDRQ